MKPRFGGGRSSGFVTVYDDVDARIKYDTKVNLNRVSVGGHVDISNARAARALFATGRDCSNGAFVSSLILLNF